MYDHPDAVSDSVWMAIYSRTSGCGHLSSATGAHYPEPPYQLYPWVNPVPYLFIFRTVSSLISRENYLVFADVRITAQKKNGARAALCFLRLLCYCCGFLCFAFSSCFYITSCKMNCTVWFGSETVEFLKLKADQDMDVKKQELDIENSSKSRWLNHKISKGICSNKW